MRSGCSHTRIAMSGSPNTDARLAPGHALQLVEDVEVRVVVDVRSAVAVVRRIDRQHHHDPGRLLVDRDALLHDDLRELRRRLAHAVLHVHLVDVGVAARLEHDGDADVARRRARRLEVEQVVEAIQLRLDRRGDRVGDHLRRRTRIRRSDRHLRRRELGILLDGRHAHRDQPAQHEQDRDDRRQDRPVDEEVREHAKLLLRGVRGLGCVAGLRRRRLAPHRRPVPSRRARRPSPAARALSSSRRRR